MEPLNFESLLFTRFTIKMLPSLEFYYEVVVIKYLFFGRPLSYDCMIVVLIELIINWLLNVGCFGATFLTTEPILLVSAIMLGLAIAVLIRISDIKVVIIARALEAIIQAELDKIEYNFVADRNDEAPLAQIITWIIDFRETRMTDKSPNDIACI